MAAPARNPVEPIAKIIDAVIVPALLARLLREQQARDPKKAA